MKKITLLVALTGLIFITSCKQKGEAENPQYAAEVAEQLSQLYKDYIDLSLKGDSTGIISFMTNDYINMPAYGITTNRKETEDMINNVFKNSYWIKLDYKRTELFVHNDMAYEFGLMDQTRIKRANQDTVNFNNRCLTVFKKQEDGSWKLHRWIAQ